MKSKFAYVCCIFCMLFSTLRAESISIIEERDDLSSQYMIAKENKPVAYVGQAAEAGCCTASSNNASFVVAGIILVVAVACIIHAIHKHHHSH